MYSITSLIFFGQKTPTLQDHNFKRQWSWDANISQKFNFFSIWIFFRGHWRFTGWQEKGGDHLFLSSIFTCSQTFINFFCCFVSEIIAAHAITRSYMKFEFEWLNINFVLLVNFISDLITSISQFPDKQWIWTHIDNDPIITNDTIDQVSWSFRGYPHFCQKKWHIWIFRLIWANYFSH